MDQTKRELIEKALEFVRYKEKSKEQLIQELSELRKHVQGRDRVQIEWEPLKSSPQKDARDQAQPQEPKEEEEKGGLDQEEEERFLEGSRERSVEGQTAEASPEPELEELFEEVGPEAAFEEPVVEVDFEPAPQEPVDAAGLEPEFEEPFEAAGLEPETEETLAEEDAPLQEISELVEARPGRSGEELPDIEAQIMQMENWAAELEARNLELEAKLEERGLAEQVLRQGEAQYRTLAASAPVMLWMASPEGMFNFVNRSWLDFTGRSREAEEGLGWLDNVHPDDLEYCRKTYEAALEVEQPFTIEHRLRRFDGEYRWVSTSGKPCFDEGFTGYLGTCVDVTERKEQEKRLLENQRKLQSLVTELTLSGERERRQLAGQLAERMSPALGQSVERLWSLQQQIDELRNAVEQTARGTAGMVADVAPPVLDEQGLVPAVEWLAEAMSQRHTIPVLFEDDGEPKPLDEDTRLILYKAAQELLLNVSAHSQADQAKVSLRSEGEQIRIEVEDDGIGFDPAEADYASPKNGFGLFAIRQQLEVMGGKLRIERRASGQGARVILTAPLTVDQD